MKKIIKIKNVVGNFAENKDLAKKLRVEVIIPGLSKGHEVILDFGGVKGATQSFIHALISDPIREFKDIAYDQLSYKNTSENLREIITIVYRYMQESLENDR